MTLGELRGLLFALNALPELVKPSEWTPFVFSGEETAFRDMEEAQGVMGSLMQRYNDINTIVRAKGSRPPPGCDFLDPPMVNPGSCGPKCSLPVWKWKEGQEVLWGLRGVELRDFLAATSPWPSVSTGVE